MKRQAFLNLILNGYRLFKMGIVRLQMYLVCVDKIVNFHKKLVPLLNYIILLTIVYKQTGLL
ncbi:hypothetical protein BCY89_14445 [Sphingobacterium siyangense]|jgi:hypothetical protein|uniref:Uncharacterized protein n=1 Tax=Sphingobacterium siyangense TaxID=459529 RepID=A0A420FHF4_9SPHI|nr:hypothetical protein BV902_01515 [Sphingobacterium sp. B29]RKF32384.1 hypothetical protein BCY89_14445 [Sphingobacterium siyangense]HAF36392.1 hypothetical protein [Sphingobacterium sp.]